MVESQAVAGNERAASKAASDMPTDAQTNRPGLRWAPSEQLHRQTVAVVKLAAADVPVRCSHQAAAAPAAVVVAAVAAARKPS